MESSVQLLFVVFFSSVIAVFAKEKVPVLVWTNDGSIVFPQQLAGHTINQHSFRKSFVDGLASNQNIVLFMQDKLSVTDFTRFADIYGTDDEEDSFSNIKSLMSEMTSTFLPSVASPAPALMELKHETSRTVHVVDDAQDISLGSDEGLQLIIIRLPELQQSHKSLSHLDEIIGLVTSKMRALSRPFIAYYTASTHAHQSSSFKSHHHSRRLMSATGAASGVFVNVSDSFFFYANNITIVSNGSSTPIDTIQVDERSQCNETGDECMILLMFQSESMSNLGVYNPVLSMEFNRTTGINTGYWYLSRFALSYWKSPAQNSTVERNPMDNDFVSIDYKTDFIEMTPFGFSYHCNKLPTLSVKNATGGDSGLSIYLDNYQVQAFGIKNGVFGHYNDCIGFFTIGTWMFLLTTLVLLAVLFFGIIMILNLTTMDRFDDAKGKTITVAVGD